MIKSKRAGENILPGTIIFLLLNILFFSMMLFFVYRAGTGSSMIEKKYCREIALIIDSMKIGTEADISLEQVFESAKSNGFLNTGQNVFSFDFQNNTITIRTAKGYGHSYSYFTNVSNSQVLFDTNKKILIINLTK